MNDSQKIKILMENGFEMIKGYTFDTSDEGDNIVLSKEELEETLKKEPTLYFWNDEHCENCYLDLESAWDYFLDDWYEKQSEEVKELSADELEELMLKEYRELLK